MLDQIAINAARSASLVTEFVEAGQALSLWGDRTCLWFEPDVASWQGVVTLLNAVIQRSLTDDFQEPEDPRVIRCNLDQVASILQTLRTDPKLIDTVLLTPVSVTSAERQRWVERLDWNEAPPGDGPLHFYCCQRSPVHLGVVIPLEAVDDWISQWDNEFWNWQDDQRKVAPRLAQSQAAMAQVQPAYPSSALSELEAWARQLDELDPTQANTHGEWNRLHRALVPTGIFEPEDAGDLVQALVEQGYPTLAEYREASLALQAHAPIVSGIFLPNCEHPLAATVSFQWFRAGPFHSDRWNAIAYLQYGLHTFLNSAPQPGSGSFASSMGGFISGSFYYAQGLGGMSQLYRGGQAVDDTPFDGDRLCTLSGRLSRAGHLAMARILSAIGVLHEPEQFQHWVELGMTLWYDGRPAEGMACLEHAATLDQGFSLSPFFRDKRAECSTSTSLPENPGNKYLYETVPKFLATWQVLPPADQFALVWLRSLLREPALTPSWLALLRTMGDGYLSREILRGLPPATRDTGARHFLCRKILVRREVVI